jgi:hypothetical protein
MNTQNVRYWAALLFSLVLLGCSKTDSKPPPALSLDQIQPVLQQAFANASAEIQSSVNEYVQSMLKHDLAAALTELQELRAKPGLTSDQRSTLARAMITTTRELQVGMDSGDEQATEALRTYRVSK